MSNDNLNEDAVGYCQPPKKNQFQKGKSGNPKGRTKTKKDIASTLHKVFDEPITYREGNKVKTMTVEAAAWRAQIEQAMEGNVRACTAIFTKAERSGLVSPIPVISPKEQAPGGYMLIGDPQSIEEWEREAIPAQAKLAKETMEAANLSIKPRGGNPDEK